MRLKNVKSGALIRYEQIPHEFSKTLAFFLKYGSVVTAYHKYKVRIIDIHRGIVDCKLCVETLKTLLYVSEISFLL